MANRGAKGGLRGHGPSQAPRRYAWPSRVNRSKGGAYLKAWGSRPAAKRPREQRAA